VESDNLKALVRLVHCQLETGNLDSARENLKHAVMLDATSPAVKFACGELNKKKASYAQKQKSMYQRMLGGGGGNSNSSNSNSNSNGSNIVPPSPEPELPESDENLHLGKCEGDDKPSKEDYIDEMMAQLGTESNKEEEEKKEEEKKFSTAATKPTTTTTQSSIEKPIPISSNKSKNDVTNLRNRNSKKKTSKTPVEAPTPAPTHKRGSVDDGETEEQYTKRMEREENIQALKEIALWLVCVAIICYFGWGFALQCIEDKNQERRLEYESKLAEQTRALEEDIRHSDL